MMLTVAWDQSTLEEAECPTCIVNRIIGRPRPSAVQVRIRTLALSLFMMGLGPLVDVPRTNKVEADEYMVLECACEKRLMACVGSRLMSTCRTTSSILLEWLPVGMS
jgi:hypothetical protein